MGKQTESFINYSNQNNNIQRQRTEVSRVSLLYANKHYAPVINNKTVAYMSGANQITQFTFDMDNGFTVIYWVRDDDGCSGHIKRSLRFEMQVEAIWQILNDDLKFGRARLYDQSSKRGMGVNPKERSCTSATDDISVIIGWIKRCEHKLTQLYKKQKAEFKKINQLLLDGFDEDDLEELGIDKPTTTNKTASRQSEDDLNNLTSEQADRLLADLFKDRANKKPCRLGKFTKDEKIAAVKARCELQEKIAKARSDAGDVERAKYFCGLVMISQDRLFDLLNDDENTIDVAAE